MKRKKNAHIGCQFKTQLCNHKFNAQRSYKYQEWYPQYSAWTHDLATFYFYFVMQQDFLQQILNNLT